MKNGFSAMMLVAMVGLFIVPVRADVALPPQDIMVVGDFSGVGFAQAAKFQPSTGMWSIPSVLCSAAPCTPIQAQWGTMGDVPHAADVNGDGRAELIIYRPSEGTWYITNLASPVCVSNAWPCQPLVVQWGGKADDLSYVADFDGDGLADLGIYRQSTGDLWVLRTACEGGIYSCYSYVPSSDPK